MVTWSSPPVCRETCSSLIGWSLSIHVERGGPRQGCPLHLFDRKTIRRDRKNRKTMVSKSLTCLSTGQLDLMLYSFSKAPTVYMSVWSSRFSGAGFGPAPGAFMTLVSARSGVDSVLSCCAFGWSELRPTTAIVRPRGVFSRSLPGVNGRHRCMWGRDQMFEGWAGRSRPSEGVGKV